MMRMLIGLLILFLPSAIKIMLLRFLGYKIGNNCYLGLSLIQADMISIEDECYIGHGNLIWRLKKFHMGRGSRISSLNWISGAKNGTFELGANSSISMLHFFEASSNIFIRSNCIVAGRSSQFFTHGITPTNIDDRRSITIGDWCYIGSAVRMVPGTSLADHTFVGMGAVVTKNFSDNFVLIVGCPAVVKKKLSPNSSFFNRSYLPHAHHSPDYRG